MNTSDPELQEASWTSITDLIEAASDNGQSLLEETTPQTDSNQSASLPMELQLYIWETFWEVCKYYNGNSLVFLLDMIGFFSKIFVNTIKQENVIEMIMTSLTAKWNELSDEDKMIQKIYIINKLLNNCMSIIWVLQINHSSNWNWNRLVCSYYCWKMMKSNFFGCQLD